MKRPLSLLGMGIATGAIVVTVAVRETGLEISQRILPYLAAASLGGLLLGLAGRWKKEDVWRCLASTLLGAVGVGLQHPVLAVVLVLAVLVGASITPLMSARWLGDALLGVFVTVVTLLLMGVSFPGVFLAVAIFGGLGLLIKTRAIFWL
jgi:hypothetical protein